MLAIKPKNTEPTKLIQNAYQQDLVEDFMTNYNMGDSADEVKQFLFSLFDKHLKTPIQQTLEQQQQQPALAPDNQLQVMVAALQQQLIQMQQQQLLVAPAPLAKKPPNIWQLYQKAWSAWKKEQEPDTIPKEIGERTKFTSHDYNNIFKKLSPNEQQLFFRQYIPDYDAVPAAAAPAAKKAPNVWQRYQKAWSAWKKEQNGDVPKNVGERSKACSADYKEHFKNLPTDQKELFFTKYIPAA